MFPIGDDDRAQRTVPVVTFALIAINILFFFVELSRGEPFIEHWSVVPRRLIANLALLERSIHLISVHRPFGQQAENYQVGNC